MSERAGTALHNELASAVCDTEKGFPGTNFIKFYLNDSIKKIDLADSLQAFDKNLLSDVLTCLMDKLTWCLTPNNYDAVTPSGNVRCNVI